ncbi:hypothetical protein CXB51_009222 [Gossypium anomalum]|uniref:RNase H type-1 domain-containing protein n=1 Tax=Gossypium anomalum TaxID=47600 RepID=A0A8J5Z7Q8_9ROSI|nr:hypothetical protein CXB51_009222 [Gossypium anomalum]
MDEFKTSTFSQRQDEWVSPGSDCMKVDFDASFNPITKSSISRVLIRDSLGLIMVASTYPHYGITDAFVAKAQAGEQAINFMVDLGFRLVQVEGDSLTFLDRQANTVVHALAVEGHHFQGSQYWVEEAPQSAYAMIIWGGAGESF